MDYLSAGVDIQAGNALVKRIKPHVANTRRKEVLGGLGGFGALFELDVSQYKQPVLVSGADGVGTKVKLAIQHNRHQTIGIDLVAMCVNDILVQGAEPLFFLDYYATAHLQLDVAESVIAGIAKGCEIAGCALVGGETAEMPGMYQSGDYDLAGFAVGAVEKSAIINGQKVARGDQLVALASSGFHSNGYSLINHLIETRRLQDELHTLQFEQDTLLDYLLRPTRIYVKPLLQLLEKIDIHAMCHITGGGITENLPRILPEYHHARMTVWQLPEVMRWLQSVTGLPDEEMLQTFNCGIGMILVVAEEDTDSCMALLQDLGENPFHVGNVTQALDADSRVVYVR